MRHIPDLARSDSPRPDGSLLPLRAGVGIMLLNGRGEVWVGKRRPKWVQDGAHIWQMPQGGIERYEPPRLAALRELREETGVRSVDVLAEHPQWLTYELPQRLVGVALKGRYRGQRQKWFAMRFLGDDREIDVRPKDGLKAEFDDWRWVALSSLSDHIVPFKRAIYAEVAGHFAHLTG